MLAIVLGVTTNAFDETIHLLNYGFAAFERITLLKQGQPFGEFEPLEFGTQLVVVLSGRDVTAVSRKRGPRTVGYRFIPNSAITPPIVAGMKIGRVEVRLNGRLVAVVDGLAAPQPAPVPSPTTVPSHGVAQPLAVVRALLFLAALIRAALDAFL